jgi:protein O-mannosyl-transferase
VALAAAVLVVISIAVWLGRNRNCCWLFGWLWFLGTLAPVIGLVQVGDTAMADRYTYIPSIGIFAAIVFGLDDWCSRRAGNVKIIMRAAWLLPAVCIALTEVQLGYWRNTETLFRHALAVVGENSAAHDCLGVSYEQQGRNEEALAEYREAVRLNPNHYQLRLAIGNLLEKLGKPADALVEYRLCLARNPEVPALHNAAGSALAAEGKLDEALPEFAEAERLDPHYAGPHLAVAKIYFAHGEDKPATDELQVAAQAEPYDYETLAIVAHYLAANANDAARDAQSALALALKANDLAKNREPEVFDVLGMAFAATGDYSNAVICAQNALEFAPPGDVTNVAVMRQRLELYQKGEPWRESFRGTNGP